MLHPLPLPLSSCLGCIPPLIGLPSLRFYAVGSSLFLLSVCFCLCSLFYRDDVLCWLLLARPFLYAFHAHLRFPVDLVWFRLSCDHGWIRSGSVNVRKQQKKQQQQLKPEIPEHSIRPTSKDLPVPIKLGTMLLLLLTTCTIHKVTQTHPALSAIERNNHGPVSTIKTPASSKSTPCGHSVVLLISSMNMETLSCEVGAPASLHPSNAPILLKSS